jgi:O-6-methylguanine DNA methyltransferase
MKSAKMKLRATTKPPPIITWGVATSPAGKLVVGMTDKGEVCRLEFLKKNDAADIAAKWQSEWPRTTFTRGAIAKDFATKPILMVGTDFQQSVWRIMAKIPRGSVTTYGGIAAHLGKPNAFRAVGGACGANPVPYLVPCHRVIAANGGLGGFSSGLDVKRALLKAEGYL